VKSSRKHCFGAYGSGNQDQYTKDENLSVPMPITGWELSTSVPVYTIAPRADERGENPGDSNLTPPT
jgi:hypothetical protein